VTDPTVRVRDASTTPYRGSQPADIRDDLVIADLLPADERLWVALDDGVWSRPLMFDVTHGGWAHVLRVTREGIVARHRHTGPVLAFIQRGRWHYLEHDWMATEGGFVYEPPGETHTLVVPEGCEEMITTFDVQGALIYVDPDGTPIGYDDVFTRLEKARRHFAEHGIEPAVLEAMIR
jgi:2,4'-dihydroxyacetophenone dioxygenase